MMLKRLLLAVAGLVNAKIRPVGTKHAVPSVASRTLLRTGDPPHHRATAANSHHHHLPITLPDLTWTSERGAILLNGKQFHIKGVSWFGLETDARAPHGLWSTTLHKVLDFLAANEFNVLRLPFSLAVARNLQLPVPANVVSADPSLHGLSVGDLIDRVMAAAAERGILVVLALHNVGTGRPEGLWYASDSSYADFQDAWRAMLGRYGNARHWNLLGIDLLNRPGRGRAKWGVDDATCDWNLAAQDTAATLLGEFAHSFHGLCFVQGIEGGAWAANYATDLRGALAHPIDLFTPENNKRVVYVAIIMGPSVSPTMNYMYSTQYPENLYAAYDELFGQTEKGTGRAVLIAKWGGTFNDDQQGDAMWQRAVAEYLVARCMDDQIYWAVNPNSASTGGILFDDWRTPNADKLALLARVQPTPSKLAKVGGGGGDRWTFVPGSSAKPPCNVA